MRSFLFEPFLWIHVAGLATLPIFFELCLFGLAVGDPVFPVWLELSLVGAIGIIPVLWMQLSRPFLIFAVLGIAQKPEELNAQQRRILRLIHTPLNRVLSVLVAIFLAGVLWQLYRIAPIAAAVTPFDSGWRLVGLLLASIAFLAGNLFVQIPVSVVRVFVTSETEFAATEPYAKEKIPQDFTILGFQVPQILPQLTDTVITED